MTRQLCITELIHEADNNKDEKLNFDEFKEIMDEDYMPSSQGLYPTVLWYKMKNDWYFQDAKMPSNKYYNTVAI